MRSMAKKALIYKRIHPHVIRHTFTTTLLYKGADLKTVQALMGHSHIRTTERYLHSTDDRKVEAIWSLKIGNLTAALFDAFRKDYFLKSKLPRIKEKGYIASGND